MAQCIASATYNDGFAPHKLILLDPPPLFYAKEPKDFTLRDAALGLISVLLATVAEMSDREDEQQKLLKSLDARVAAWPEDEVAIRATEQLAQAGLRPNSIEAVLRTKQQLLVFADSGNFLHRSRASQAALAQSRASCAWKTFLMVSEDRVPFLVRLGSSAEEASVDAARAYGHISQEMVCDAAGGGHFAETVSCAMGENLAFVAALRGFLAFDPDLRGH